MGRTPGRGRVGVLRGCVFVVRGWWNNSVPVLLSRWRSQSAEILPVLRFLWCTAHSCPCPPAWQESPRWVNHPPPGWRRKWWFCCDDAGSSLWRQGSRPFHWAPSWRGWHLLAGRSAQRHNLWSSSLAPLHLQPSVIPALATVTKQHHKDNRWHSTERLKVFRDLNGIPVDLSVIWPVPSFMLLNSFSMVSSVVWSIRFLTYRIFTVAIVSSSTSTSGSAQSTAMAWPQSWIRPDGRALCSLSEKNALRG